MCVPLCVYVHHMSTCVVGVCGRALEMELQVVVRAMWVLETILRSPVRAAGTLRVISPSSSFKN